MTPSRSGSGPVVRPDEVGRSSSMVWIVGLVVVVIAGLLAVFIARGPGDSAPPIEDETAAVKTIKPASGGSTTAPTFIEGGLPAIGTDSDPAVGMTIPEMKGTTVDGKPITIGPSGGPKVIVFMAHWCPHCRAEIPRLVDHFAADGEPEGVKIFGVSTRVDTKAPNYPPSTWLKDAGWTVPTMADSQDLDALRLFGVSSFPYFVVVDDTGKVLIRTSGELTMETFDSLVEAARTGKLPDAG
ncbi:MAG: redoxin family protein [Acidimicrobiales bacterium]|nr:redoxin family protein [Acidimicrobiales bacterium]